MNALPIRRARGFTLIEVVVAMAIIVAVLAGLFFQISRVADTSIDLRQRTLAQWIALNRVVELRLSGVPPVGQRAQGIVEYASQKWRWESQIMPMSMKQMRRIRVRVALESAPKDAWTTTVDGFTGQALGLPGSGSPIPPWQGTPNPGGGGGPPPVPGGPTT